MSERWALPRTTLPDGVERELWVEDGRITGSKVLDAAPLPGRFVAPGLVDAHVHLAITDRQPLGMPEALEKLRAARDQGVLLVRDMGAPGSITLELPDDPMLPPVIASGRQLALEGRFFPGCHEPVPPERLVDAALEEVSRGATWVKVLTDWIEPGLSYPIETIRAMVDVVHGRGARVAAHCVSSHVADVVATGVDSIEHGSGLDEATLRVMARAGIAWAPTSGAIEDGLARVNVMLADNGTLSPELRARAVAWQPIAQTRRDTVAAMVPIASRLGVTLLASTDNIGSVADEVARFVSYGVDPIHALRAATTDARAFLGAPGLEDGAPADFLTFERDPRDDPSVLDAPAAIILRGHRIR